MDFIQQLECKKWQFENIPEFNGGKPSPVFADCGDGLESGASFMHYFADTDSELVEEYAALLEKSGFEKLYENRICDNLFYQFKFSGGMLWISFMSGQKVTRIILDTCTQSDAASFGYSEYDSVRPDTVMAQYSLHYGDMIKGITCDCGMNYVFRLRDNSLIIIDGGEMEQSTDIAVDDYMSFLRELTGTEDEKIRISLWLCTHAHNDHCDFFSKIILKHSDEISLERAAFNFPNPQNTGHSASVATVKQRISEKFPTASYIKIHAGTAFNIANAKLEALVSNEDTVGADPEDAFPGTNDTSVIFKITADDVSSLFLADCPEDSGNVLIKNYKNAVTDCDFLQAAHHGINTIYEVYEKINAGAVLLPQCRMNMETRFAANLEHLNRRYGENNIYYAHDATDIFSLAEGRITSLKRRHIGVKYDNSEW